MLPYHFWTQQKIQTDFSQTNIKGRVFSQDLEILREYTQQSNKNTAKKVVPLFHTIKTASLYPAGYKGRI